MRFHKLESNEYFRQFPKTPEQLKAEADAAQALTKPKTLEQSMAEQTREKRAEMEKALRAISEVNGPTNSSQNRGNQPGRAGLK
jgi:hypothetical protein